MFPEQLHSSISFDGVWVCIFFYCLVRCLPGTWFVCCSLLSWSFVGKKLLDIVKTDVAYFALSRSLELRLKHLVSNNIFVSNNSALSNLSWTLKQNVSIQTQIDNISIWVCYSTTTLSLSLLFSEIVRSYGDSLTFAFHSGFWVFKQNKTSSKHFSQAWARKTYPSIFYMQMRIH